MKNVVKKIVLSVMFALTMVFVAGVEVSAADTFPVKENMNVEAKEGAVFKIDLEAGGLSKETVYVVIPVCWSLAVVTVVLLPALTI